MSFWRNLKKPIIGLAPMDGITDEPMRFIQGKYGRPTVIFTEFINVEHIAHKAEKLMKRFLYSEIERPIIAQLSGHTPELFYQFALVVCYLGFDGIDINMGCPVKSVIFGGGGAALIDNQQLAGEIVLAARRAIDSWQKGISLKESIEDENIIRAILAMRKMGDSKRKIGLSVKTRLGKDSRATEGWINFLSQLPIDAITLHGRVLGQEQSGKVRWEEISKGAKIARKHGYGKVFLGNGGVRSLEEAKAFCQRFGIDGVLIGRGALGNPWIFRGQTPSREEKLAVMLEHADYFERIFEKKAFVAMRKHFGWYAQGFRGAKKMKQILQKSKTLNQVKAMIRNS